jgi:DNA-binding NtrC family response regulator
MNESNSSSSCRRLRVLVVEDDTDMRWTIRDVLMMHGHLVNTAQNGTAAAAMAADDDYDVVITDIRLPGMSGIELMRNIQRSSQPPEIIVITAYPEWHAEAQIAGAARVLRKPLNLAVLANIVEQSATDRREPQ